MGRPVLRALHAATLDRWLVELQRLSEARGCAYVEGFGAGLREIEHDNRQGEKCCRLQCGDGNLLSRETEVWILAQHVPLARRAVRAAANGEIVVVVQQINSDTDAAVRQQNQPQ